jgi:hypothetical protein
VDGATKQSMYSSFRNGLLRCARSLARLAMTLSLNHCFGFAKGLASPARSNSTLSSSCGVAVLSSFANAFRSAIIAEHEQKAL